MAWETRRSRKSFYYRCYRRKGRVTKRYVGSASDLTTQVIALAERLKKTERKAAAAASRAERAAYQEADALVVALCAVGQALTTAGLLKAGYYRKQRMPWQKRTRRTRMAHSGPCQVSLVAPTQDEFRQLVRRAEAGDAEALAQMEQILDLHPAVWQQAADLAARVESALIRLIASKSKLLAKSLERKVRQMKAELAGDSSSPLEKGVVERIVACWLQVQFAEVASVEHADDREANSWQKRLDQAQRRYLSAVTSLATVRKLLAR